MADKLISGYDYQTEKKYKTTKEVDPETGHITFNVKVRQLR